MTNTKKRHELPEGVTRTLTELSRNVQIAQSNQSVYLQGVIDALGLKGTWSVAEDGTALVLVEVEES